MTFKREEIKPRYIGVIDFWTYKIRVWICKILNKNVELIWYWEKRQETDDISLLEIKNLESVCNSIKQAIKKAEIDAKTKVYEFVINIFSHDLLFEASKINYNIEKPNLINEEKLYNIFKDIESIAFRNSYKKIKNNTWYNKNDLKLIINNISNIKLDWEFYTKDIVWTSPEEIEVSILNIFITEQKYALNKLIEKSLKKEIIKIIPTEYALLSLFSDRRSIVIIDLWNSHISVIVKKDSYVLWAKKLSFWINDLIKNIRKNHKISNIEIIKMIDTDNFQTEKIEFLEIFKDIIAITLEDILRWEICPNNFFITWWWANKFVKDYLENLNFNNFNLKITKKVNYISPKINFIDDKITENPNWIDWVKSNINIYAMIKSTLDIFKKDKSKFEKTIKQIVDEIN